MSEENKPGIIINDPVEFSYDQKQQVPTIEPSLKDLVLVEVRRLVVISKAYKEKIDTAKTKPKKDLYAKKIRKNNDKLADMIIRLEQLNRIESNDEPTNEQP